MAPEVIACDENPDATYDYRVRESCSQEKTHPDIQSPYTCSMNDGSFWDFLCFVGVILFCVDIFLLQEYQEWVTVKLWPLEVAITGIIIASRHKE